MAVSTPKIGEIRARLLKINVFGPLESLLVPRDAAWYEERGYLGTSPLQRPFRDGRDTNHSGTLLSRFSAEFRPNLAPKPL